MFFRKEKFRKTNAAGAERAFEVSISVDADGWFHCTLPEDLYAVAKLRRTRRERQVMAATHKELMEGIGAALTLVMETSTTEDLVIRYNAASHVSFATDPDGKIFPNAGFPDASWPRNKTGRDDMFGGHHAQNPAPGGYSLVVGARAYRKTTHRTGTHSKASYALYYGPGNDHHETDHPAGLLNSWVCFTLDDGKHQPREMPYTDEAALFFHRLMVAMADISIRIQSVMHDPIKLEAAIKSGGSPLLSHAPKPSIKPKKPR